MQFEKRLSDRRSLLALDRAGTGTLGYSPPQTTLIGNVAVQPLSGTNNPRRSLMTMQAGLIARAAKAHAVFCQVTFPGFVLAVMSWIVAELLAGCATYIEAMSPGHSDPGEQIESDDQVEQLELRAPDAMTPRDVAISHFDIACLAKQGDHRQ